MRKTRIFFSILLLIASFFIFILSLLSIFPKLIAGLLLFLSLFLTISSFNNRHRFRGFE